MKSVKDQVFDQPRDQVGRQVYWQVAHKVLDQVGRQVYWQVAHKVLDKARTES